MNNGTEQIFLLNTSDNQTVGGTQKVSESATSQVNLENVEDFSNVCRTCATITEFVIPIFMGEGLQNNLAEKIQKHLPIQVTEEDVLPRVVCYQCASTLLAWHELVQCCVQADTALKTRLSVILAKEKNLKHEEKNLETETKGKFKDLADYVAQSMESTQFVDSSNTPRELSKSCEYCGIKQPQDMYTDHLITMHSELLFHCNECDAYLDRKDFILHMSMHAIQYVASDDEKEATKRAKKLRKRKNSKDKSDNPASTKPKLSKDKETVEKTLKSSLKDNVTVDNEVPENEFSDHSDVEYFGRLPESVFEAIEDTQDTCQPDDNDPSSPKSTHNNESSPNNDKSDFCNETFDESKNPLPIRPVPRNKMEKKPKKSRSCPICSKVYTASSSYFYHLKNSHQESKEYECDICGKRFGNKSSLTQHASIHDGERRLECKQCGKRFRSKASLYIHEQSHSDVKTWACSQCNRSFRWRTHLLRHLKRHSAEKSHICTTCGRGFNIRCDLLRHARTHTAGNFTCGKCDVKFAQQRYLKVHMLKKHSIKITGSESIK